MPTSVRSAINCVVLGLVVVAAIGYSGVLPVSAEATPTPTPTWPSSAPPRYLAATPLPSPRPSRYNADSVAALLPSLPTIVPSLPQPSAFFVPRMITATAGLDQFTGARVQGRVLDWRGNPMGGVGVRASADQEFVALTNPDGSYAIDALPAGSYSVAVAGYGGLPASPLPVDGRSIFIVEFIEATIATTPTATATPSVTPTLVVATPTAKASVTVAATAVISRTPVSAAARPTTTPKPDSSLLSAGDVDYLKQLLLTPFLLGAVGGYGLFLLGIFGATLRRRR